MARHRRVLVAAVDDEIVALGLAADGFIDRGEQAVIAVRGAQRSAKIRGIVLAKAHEQGTGAGHAHAVAGFAEVVGERGDEAQPPTGLLYPNIAGRPAGAVIDLVECELPGELRPYRRKRQVLVEPPAVDIPERHDFDQGDVPAKTV